MKILLTSISGLESLVRKEMERIGLPVIGATDRQVEIQGDWKTVALANLASRTASRIWAEIATREVATFDDVFAAVSAVDWKNFLPKDAPLLVSATILKSQITSESALQSIGKKAIMDSVLGGQYGMVREDSNLPAFHVQLLLTENHLHILLDTTGKDALHKRGYRRDAGEAPLKESLAAGMVQLGQWDFRTPFYDPFCGAGTLAIEAALYALNIAPGLHRTFAFEAWSFVPADVRKEAEEELAKHQTLDRKITIIASDNDPSILEKAKKAAAIAGVADRISFMVRDFVAFPEDISSGCLVCNPPYGIRMGAQEDLSFVYKKLAHIFTKNTALTGGVLTAWEGSQKIFSGWKGRKFRVGGQDARFWRKA